MTTQLCSRGKVAVFRVGISAVALLSVLMVRERTMATPVLAQAYGTACHTQMPLPNTFGRYILDDDRASVLAEVNGAGQGRLPNIDVGVHNDAHDYVGGPAGTKFDFVPGKTPLPAAYLGNANGMSPFGDAHDSGFNDMKNDPRPGSPGYRCEYGTATYSNPGYLSPRVASNPIQPAGSTVSSWRIGSARQMVEHHRTVNFTYYQTNQALSGIGVTRLIPPTGVQTGGGAGFSYAINPYTRFYTMVSLQNQRPALSILMRFKPPLWSHLK